MSRTFEDVPAKRVRVPLLVGLVGPSGTGKTFSALRLATGVQRVCGGEIFVIDTESRRALHYAPKEGESANPAKGTFSFRHVPFGAPFCPLDYLAAIEHCVKRGAKTVVIDSLSHEHEGPGGVLEQHTDETERLLRTWKNATEEKVNFPAWKKPKEKRRRLINTVLQMDVNVISCFRAKRKLKVVPGKQPIDMGWQGIGGDEYIYELTVKFLLVPGSAGTPIYKSDFLGEKELIKLPQQFAHLSSSPRQLSEDIGETMARWAAGDDTGQQQANLQALANDCLTIDQLEDVKAEAKRQWKSMSVAQRKATTEAIAAAQSRLEATPFDDDTGELEEPSDDWEPEELQPQ